MIIREALASAHRGRRHAAARRAARRTARRRGSRRHAARARRPSGARPSGARPGGEGAARGDDDRRAPAARSLHAEGVAHAAHADVGRRRGVRLLLVAVPARLAARRLATLSRLSKPAVAVPTRDQAIAATPQAVRAHARGGRACRNAPLPPTRPRGGRLAHLGQPRRPRRRKRRSGLRPSDDRLLRELEGLVLELLGDLADAQLVGRPPWRRGRRWLVRGGPH